MAFIKLRPFEGRSALSVADVTHRLTTEFAVVDVDPEEGRAHVAGMLTATLRFSDAVPGKQGQLEWLRSVQDSAVHVFFGDDATTLAGCCVMPDSELFFGSPDEVDGAARSLVERAAVALGYSLFQG
jgi:hypothetical protein